MDKPIILQGGTHSDHRGSLRFVNDFIMTDVVRFYVIKHDDTNFIRAWQAHKKERKYFYVLKGSFLVVHVKIDDFDHPSPDLKAEYNILSESESEILTIPDGYANGLKALEPDSEIMIFSNLTLGESKSDDYRFPAEWWFDWKLIKKKGRRQR